MALFRRISFAELRAPSVTRARRSVLVRGLTLATREAIVRVGEVTAEALVERFGIAAPRIAVMGLNPHASDGGRFGDEEERIIAPAMDDLRACGWNVTGPIAPDTAPFRMLRGDFDAAVAMYHEQAALPVKTGGTFWPRASPAWTNS